MNAGVMAFWPDILAWIAFFFVVVFAVVRLGSLTRTAYRSGKIRLSRVVVGAAMALLTLSVLLLALPYLASKFVDLTTPRAKFWLQTVAGNWSPDSFPPFTQTMPKPVENNAAAPGLSAYETYEFSISAAVAFWLNNAILFLLINLVWRISKMKKELDIAAALVMRDSFAKSAAKTLVRENFDPQEQERILEVFKEALEQGQSDLERHLPNIDDHGTELLKTMGIIGQRHDGPSPH